MTSLFAAALGDAAFSTLSPRVQALHAASGNRIYRGRADVQRGEGLISNICAFATSLPNAGTDVPLQVEIQSSSDSEIWLRDFSGKPMRSQFHLHSGLLWESLGAGTFGFELTATQGELHWRVRSFRTLGIPMPARWFVDVRAREFESDGRYCFEVDASLPAAGRLVFYRGWLDV